MTTRNPTSLDLAVDAVWLECARKLEIPVARGGISYVHFDGRTLHLADDHALDADDTVAQLVLHEICHLLVEGPAARHQPDWTLDNTDDRDSIREEAAVRVQAHLAGAYGLRRHLFPTTVVRPFFEALPADALGHADTPSSSLARLAATRAGRWPYDPTLDEALGATAALLSVKAHPKSGHALAVDGRTCGDCAWRSDGGLCRRASRRAFVTVGEPACTRHETKLDCLDCGACCRSAFDSVEVGAREPVIKRHPSLIVFRESFTELARAGDRCAALDGAPAGPYHCRIYDDRPRTCRDFTLGSKNCVTARRRVGLSV